jgi:Ni2+-binding GTPase involved in maturation of urease and hydrogenase
MMNNDFILTLYVRVDCPLCDDMQRQLEKLQRYYDFSVVVVDIDTEPDLQKCYDTEIPVLVINGRELCRHFLDEEMLLNYFDFESN